MDDGGVAGVRKGVAVLAVAGFVEYGLQFLLPILLVRTLTVAEYGDYRLVWLTANTILAITPLFMPQSLFFFLPRNQGEERSLALGNVMMFMTVAGLAAGLGFLGVGATFYHGPGYLAIGVFLGLWTFAHLLDWLPVTDGDPVWQGRIMVGMALLRTLLLSCAAILSQDMMPIIYALVIAAGIKVLMVFVYARRAFGLANLRLSAPLFREQVKYALPFAISNAALFFRGQADQWIVTGLFSAKALAVFSVAASVLPISTLLRRPFINATLSRLSAAMQSGDMDGARSLVRMINVSSALLLFPILGGLFVCAEEVVAIIYTEAYRDAAAIMRIYLVGMTTGAFAMGHVLVAVNWGKKGLRIDILCVLVSLTVGFAGATWLGPIGAALGSMTGYVLAQMLVLLVAAKAMQTNLSELLGWDITSRIVIATLAAVLMSLWSKTGLSMHGHTAAVILLFESLAYMCSLAVGMAVLGLWREIGSITGLTLKFSSKR